MWNTDNIKLSRQIATLWEGLWGVGITSIDTVATDGLTALKLASNNWLYVKGDGNVGIGLTDPFDKLQLSASVAGKPVVQFNYIWNKKKEQCHPSIQSSPVLNRGLHVAVPVGSPSRVGHLGLTIRNHSCGWIHEKESTCSCDY